MARTAEFTVELAFEDLFDAAWTLFLRRARVGVIVYGVVALGVAGAWALIPSNWPRLPLHLLGALLVAAPLFVFGFLYRINQLDFQRSDPAQRRIRYKIGADGLQARSGKNLGIAAWDELWDAAESRRSFLVCVSPQEQYVLPKRFFPGLDEQELLRGLTREAAERRRSAHEAKAAAELDQDGDSNRAV